MNLVNRIESSGPYISFHRATCRGWAMDRTMRWILPPTAPASRVLQAPFAGRRSRLLDVFHRLPRTILPGETRRVAAPRRSRASDTTSGEEFGAARLVGGFSGVHRRADRRGHRRSDNAGASVRLGMMYLGGSFRRGPLFHYSTAFFAGPALAAGALPNVSWTAMMMSDSRCRTRTLRGWRCIPVDTSSSIRVHVRPVSATD